MSIAKMSKVYLLAHQDDKEKILDVLQQSGVLEISDFSATAQADADWILELDNDQEQEALQSLEKSMAKVRFNLDFLNRHHPVKKGILDDLLAEKKAITLTELQSSVPDWAELSDSVYSTLRNVDEEMLALRNEKTRLQNLQQQLLPWRNLTLPIEEIKDTKATRMELGAIPAAQFDDCRAELLAQNQGFCLEGINNVRGEIFALLIYHGDDAETVQKVLKQFNFNKHVLPALTGTVSENLTQLERELAKVEQAQQQALATIGQQVQHRETLQYYHDYLSVQHDKAQMVERLVRTESTFLLEGWVRTADAAKLKKRISALSETIELVVRDPQKGENFPVVLENKPFFAPFEFVTRLYGTPSPYGTDPTASFTLFFIIFFGFCLTDAGYGLVLMGLAALGLLKLKGENMRKLMKILFWGGLSTIVIGHLVGGWFGYQILGAPLAFDALQNPLLLLIYALGLGVVHIFVGMGVKFVNLAREGKYFDALADVGLWYVLLIGLGLLALPSTAEIGQYMAMGGAIGLVLTQGRHQPTLIKKLLSGLVSLYDVTGYFSDILSYSRLLALGLATGVVGLAINTMAGLLNGHPIGWVAMVILLFIGHTFNLVINGLGSFIHSSRLQYIEFYNRFYEGGGRAFMPFRFNTHHLEIQSEKFQEN